MEVKSHRESGLPMPTNDLFSALWWVRALPTVVASATVPALVCWPALLRPLLLGTAAAGLDAGQCCRLVLLDCMLRGASGCCLACQLSDLILAVAADVEDTFLQTLAS